MNNRIARIVFTLTIAFSIFASASCHAQAFGGQQTSGQEVQSRAIGGLQPVQQQRPVGQSGVQGALTPVQPSATASPYGQGNPYGQTTASTQPHTIEPKSPETFQLKGRFHLVNGTRSGFLILRAEIPEGSYIYSLSNAEGPGPSTVAVAPGTTFRTGERFDSDRHPIVIEHDEVLGCRLEKHYSLVQFYVPIEIAEGVDPATVRPEITFNGQICSADSHCMLLRDQRVAADFAGYFEQQADNSGNSTESRR
ncbi:MAG: hypothetical protein AAF456_17450 [Planctomycetota bacterium]